MRSTWRNVSLLVALSVAWLGLSIASSQAEEAHKHRLLFYNRSAGFEHSVVQVKDDKPCYAETILRPICEKHGWELVSTKDGDIFTPENIAKFDAFLFYTTGDLTGEATNKTDHSKPMSQGRQASFSRRDSRTAKVSSASTARQTRFTRASSTKRSPPISVIRTSICLAASLSFTASSRKPR